MKKKTRTDWRRPPPREEKKMERETAAATCPRCLGTDTEAVDPETRKPSIEGNAVHHCATCNWDFEAPIPAAD
jgi:hypothetical protein